MVSCSTGFSRNIKVDSLEAILQSSTPDSVKLSVLETLVQTLRYSDVEKAFDYSEQMITLAEKLQHDRYKLIAYRLLLYVHYEKNSSFETVDSCFKQALIYADKVQDSGLRSDVLNIMGAHHHRVGKDPEALSLHQEALTLATELRDTFRMIRCLNNMALLLENRDQVDLAISRYSKALNYSQLVNHPPYIAAISNNLGIIHHNKLAYDSALVLFEKSLELKRKIGNQSSMVTTLANIGRLYTDTGNFQRAQTYLDEAYEIAQKLDYPYGKALTLKNLSERSFALEQYEESIAYAKEGLKVIKETEEIWLIETKLYKILSEGYEMCGRSDLALEHLKNYHVRLDSLNEKEKMKQIQVMEFEYDLKQKEIENKLLKSEQAIIEKTLRTRTYTAIGFVVAFALAMGWALTVYRSSQQKKKINVFLEEEVRKRTKELGTINKNLEQANYELKTYNYIASHDLKEPLRNIGNYVGLIRRQLPDRQKDLLGEYFRIIKKSVAQLYTLLEDLTQFSNLSKGDSVPLEPVDFNLILEDVESSLQTLIQERKGLVQSQHLPTISSNPAIAFLSVKNLIENGLKFNESETPTVTITYNGTPNFHEIIFSDNGIGIEAAYSDKVFDTFKRLHSREQYPGSGIGLAIVKLVMNKLGGTVNLQSTLGQGSRFSLKFPK